MDSLKNMKEALVHQVQAQINGNLDKVDAHELGEAVDMIKDFAQAIYYCTITEAMEKNKEREEEYPMDEERMYYPRRYMPRRRMYHGDSWGDYPYWGGPYYYTESNMNRGNDARGYSEDNYDSRRYHENMAEAYRDLERAYPREMRDYREGKSGMSRRYYVEAKEQHKDPAVRNQELSKYMQELSDDVVEMIQDATPEEKQMLQQKLSTLVGKIK